MKMFVKNIIKILLVTLLLGAGQEINAASLADSDVNAIAVQSDGKIILGGGFHTYNDVDRMGIVRINADGSLDTSFDPGTGVSYGYHYVSAIALQPDGKIIIGGPFGAYNETFRSKIARINSDGSLDTTFDPGSGANETYIDTISIQPDGKIIIGGDFTSYNGTAVNHLARLNSDGSLDTSFNIGTGPVSGDYGRIYSSAIQQDGKIIIGGWFSHYNGTPINCIARINSNGSLDTSFNANMTNEYEDVYAINIQPDGKVMIGGEFWQYYGFSRNHIARLNTDGSVDSTFNSANTGANSTVFSISTQPDGKMIIGGSFTNYKGININRIARINSNGDLDNAFTVGTGASQAVLATSVLSSGKIIFGGDFWSYNNISTNYVGLLNTDGSLDTSFGEGVTISSPTLTTTPTTTLTSTTAQGNGDITATGGEDPERFIQWGTVSGNYTNSCTAGTGGTGQYSCQLTSLTPNTLYYIRAYATNSAGTTYGDELSFTTSPFSQSGTNQLSATIAQNMTLSCGTDIDLNGGTPLIPQTPATSQTTCTVTTNDQNGYDLQLTNDRNTNNTLYHNTQSTTSDGQITDKSRWNPSSPNATNFTGTGLAFGILTSTATKNTAWWGTGTTCSDTNQLYAGIPATTAAIMEHTDYSNTPTDTTICYQVNVPSTQISGLYEGSVTYTATGRP